MFLKTHQLHGVKAMLVLATLVLFSASDCAEDTTTDTTSSLRCPAEVPVVGEACSTTIDLCTYKRGGPCPPDPDQTRRCHNGKWTALVPTIACHPLPNGDDAGM